MIGHETPTHWDTETGETWASTAVLHVADEYVLPEEPMNGFTAQELAAVHQLATPVAPTLPTLPPSFWDSRPVLEHIRRAAWNRNRGADAVFHGTLGRLAAIHAPWIGLDTGIGDFDVSPNYFVALLGPSGSGKSSALAVARRLLTFPLRIDCLDGVGLGSGEGIAEAYMGTVEDTAEDSRGRTRKVRVRRQVRRNVLCVADEGQIMVQLEGRKGSTLGPTLRSAWSGATLGQANASDDRTRHIPAGSYSLGLVMCFQPSTIEPLLADAPGGTPQRFIFAAAIDPGIPDLPPPWPGELPVAWDVIYPAGRVSMALDETIRTEMRRTDLARNRGELFVAELDSHRPLMVLKVSALLALLDGRQNVTLDDRDLAEVVVSTSDAVRDSVIAQSAQQRAQRQAEQDDTVVRLAVRTAAEVGLVPANVKRVATSMARRLHRGDGAPAGRKALYRLLASRDRPVFDAAVDFAETQNWIACEGEMVIRGTSEPAS